MFYVEVDTFLTGKILIFVCHYTLWVTDVEMGKVGVKPFFSTYSFIMVCHTLSKAYYSCDSSGYRTRPGCGIRQQKIWAATTMALLLRCLTCDAPHLM